MMSSLSSRSLSLPITLADRAFAARLASDQTLPELVRRVNDNALSVAAVAGFLRLMAIESTSANTDLLNPVVQLCADVADLQVVGLGRLECRVVLPGANLSSIPPEVWGDRIGYVFVEINPARSQALIHGFLRSVNQETVDLSTLQPVEALLECLSELKAQRLEFVSTSPPVSPPRCCLQDWLRGIVSHEWQAVDALIASTVFTWNLGFRGDQNTAFAPKPRSLAQGAQENASPSVSGPREGVIRRAKLLEWINPTHEEDLALIPSLVLVVEVTPEAERGAQICLQLHPQNSPACLMPNVKFAVLDGAGAGFMQATSRQEDNYLQLQFRGQPGERFTVQVTVNEFVSRDFFQV
ncbi:DUF1822 family protein [Lyngbya confervoides]|uniref:DUF1822 family protein n=1 Tax=Lyngbya confervoides BDU141951 TaxID=1574623 RepID=A0ABD4TB03_9CYAN|nr:DUF1822 family protein [Lyngbya confervoides]MCM1985350.1 DUF1822 family protein [Lyngbya confervoides BDU141951]